MFKLLALTPTSCKGACKDTKRKQTNNFIIQKVMNNLRYIFIHFS